MTPHKTLGLLALGLLASASSLHATTIYGLTATNGLISFDSATPGSINSIGTISQPGIVDLDFFPVNGQLYAITSNGNTYSLDLGTAAATLLFSPLTPLSNLTDLDFNPVADRMRLFGDTDQNYRMVPNVSTGNPGTAGTIITDGTFSNPAFELESSAYTNNFDFAATTTLYSIDTTTDSLVIHSIAPQFNTVTAVGTGLGTTIGNNVGFDVGQDGIAYLSDDNNFFTVNLATGAATSAGIVGGNGLVSIAALAVPEPTSMLLGAAGLAVLAARRRRTA